MEAFFMSTDKESILKSLKYFGYTLLCFFIGPIVIYQAFKNPNHPWHLPVLIVGLLIFLAAIILGFYSIKVLTDAFFNKKK